MCVLFVLCEFNLRLLFTFFFQGIVGNRGSRGSRGRAGMQVMKTCAGWDRKTVGIKLLVEAKCQS